MRAGVCRNCRPVLRKFGPTNRAEKANRVILEAIPLQITGDQHFTFPAFGSTSSLRAFHIQQGVDAALHRLVILPGDGFPEIFIPTDFLNHSRQPRRRLLEGRLKLNLHSFSARGCFLKTIANSQNVGRKIRPSWATPLANLLCSSNEIPMPVLPAF